MTGYAVIIERAEDGGFGAWSPDLPGCVSTGRSYEECVNNMREAVVGQFEPSSSAISVSVHTWSATPAAIAGVVG